MSVTINPVLTTTAAGSFQKQSLGYVQGVALDDPAVRYALSGGYLHADETLPMWGGVAIQELTSDIEESRGPAIKRAAAYASLTGFSVFNQNFAAINSPQSPVPLSAAQMMVNFYRLGSGARIPLKIDAGLAATLIAGGVNQQVSWDFTTQSIVAFSVTALDVRILEVATENCMTVTYDAGTGFATWATDGAVAIVLI